MFAAFALEPRLECSLKLSRQATIMI
jgi:hypothetical protein